MTERPTYAKSTCCIPGCPRWSRKFPREWLCARHWRMVPGRCRRALNKVWETWGPMANHGDRAHFLAWRRMERLDTRLWDDAKRRVILREAGL